MKKHTFTVTLTLSDKVSDDEAIKEMAFKIADALRHECDSGNGLAPEMSDSFTEKIEVSNQFLPEATTVVDMSGAGSKISQ
jgi:hypothetical protein